MTNDDDGGWIGGGEPKLFNATPDVLIKIKGLVAAGGRTLGETLRRAVGVHSGDAQIVDERVEIQGDLAQHLEDMAKEKGVGVLSLVVDLLEGEQTHVVYTSP